MKLSTLAFASVLALTSTFAIAQNGGGALGGSTPGYSGGTNSGGSMGSNGMNQGMTGGMDSTNPDGTIKTKKSAKAMKSSSKHARSGMTTGSSTSGGMSK